MGCQCGAGADGAVSCRWLSPEKGQQSRRRQKARHGGCHSPDGNSNISGGRLLAPAKARWALQATRHRQRQRHAAAAAPAAAAAILPSYRRGYSVAPFPFRQ